MNRFDPKVKSAQKWLDNEVVKDTTPYVPMRTGQLYRSGITGTNYGSGVVEYTAPYAHRCYYGFNMHFSKLAHPQACAQWFEPSKAANKKKWVAGVRKIVRGG
ncbi:MAG: hypothetical protein IKP95_09375 [Ruminococcus sp.]|nr:hypothetical protein [Ruminococcus sp.]